MGLIKLTRSLQAWLLKNHPDLIFLITFGHTEYFTDEMRQQYLEWVQTEEGQQYLKGGSKYVEEGDAISES